MEESRRVQVAKDRVPSPASTCVSDFESAKNWVVLC